MREPPQFPAREPLISRQTAVPEVVLASTREQQRARGEDEFTSSEPRGGPGGAAQLPPARYDVRDGLRVIAVVPARGGTDPVPYLNIKRLGDCPLLAHTLTAAKGAPSVDRVVVTTDDPRVAEVARG